jgi:hypothetical protein
MMPKYLKQTEKNTCGVIAAMNLDIWCGKKVTSSDFDAYADAVNYDPEWGVADFCLEDWLRQHYTLVTLDKLIEHLESGGSAILCSTCHFYFVDKIQDNKIRAINFQDELISWIPCADMVLTIGWLCSRT